MLTAGRKPRFALALASAKPRMIPFLSYVNVKKVKVKFRTIYPLTSHIQSPENPLATQISPSMSLQLMRHRLRHDLILRSILHQLRICHCLSVPMSSRRGPNHTRPAAATTKSGIFQLQSPRFAPLAAQQNERSRQRDREHNPDAGTNCGEFSRLIGGGVDALGGLVGN